MTLEALKPSPYFDNLTEEEITNLNNIKIIGVTGSQGKSTCMEMLFNYLKFIGKKPAIFRSYEVESSDGRNITDFQTGKNAVEMATNLFHAIRNGSDIMLIEMPIKYLAREDVFYPFKNLDIDILVFSNFIAQAGKQKGYAIPEKYLEAKIKRLKLNKKIKKIVLNLDRNDKKIIDTFLLEEEKVFSFSKEKENAKYKFNNVEMEPDGKVTLKYLNREKVFNTNLRTSIGLENIMILITTLEAFDVYDEKSIDDFLSVVSIPGKLEFIQEDEMTTIFLDSGTDANELKNILLEMPIILDKDIISVVRMPVFDEEKNRKPNIIKSRREMGRYLSSISQKLYILEDRENKNFSRNREAEGDILTDVDIPYEIGNIYNILNQLFSAKYNNSTAILIIGEPDRKFGTASNITRNIIKEVNQ